MRQQIRAFDERLPVLGLTTLRGFAERSVFLWVFRSAARVFTAFGLAAPALLSSYIPARRATRIAPVTALRHD